MRGQQPPSIPGVLRTGVIFPIVHIAGATRNPDRAGRRHPRSTPATRPRHPPRSTRAPEEPLRDTSALVAGAAALRASPPVAHVFTFSPWRGRIGQPGVVDFAFGTPRRCRFLASSLR